MKLNMLEYGMPLKIENSVKKSLKTEVKLTSETVLLNAEIEHLKKALAESESRAAQFENKAAHFESKAQHYKEEYEKIIHQLMESNRARFGRTSERFVENDENQQQLLLFEDNSITEKKELNLETEPEIEYEEITYTRKKTKEQKNTSIPVREEIIEVENKICEHCQSEMRVIGYEESSRLNYVPAILEMIKTKREVAACNHCKQSIRTAPKPETILPKCRVTESLLAHIVVSKILDRQPLYHLEKKLEREHGWHISRETMARWMIQLSEKLTPIINLMKDELLGYDIAAIDATPLQVLNEPGGKSLAYCIRGGSPGKEVTLYEYNAYSHQNYVEKFFPDYQGKIHCDAEATWNAIGKKEGIELSYCHAHARRKFEPLAKSKHALAKQAMRIYQELYKIEREAKAENITPEARYELRQKKSKPIITEFKSWLDEQSKKILPKSPFGKAVNYCLNHWTGLQTYLTDGRLEIDNNATEREIKPFVMARKNFLFSCTKEGADSLGVLFSLVLTAKNHGLDPFRYLQTIFKAVPFCKNLDDFEKLLPWNFPKV